VGHEKGQNVKKTERKGGEIKEKRARRRKEGERKVNPPPI
jgi:hypothetical protein